MASVCVGCGLKVVDGRLALDLEPITGYVDLGSTVIRTGAELAIIAPNASSGPTNNLGVVVTELAVLQLENETCRPVTFMLHAHGRVRIDVSVTDEDAFTNANEVRNEVRINGGAWQVSDLGAFAQDPGDRQSREWIHARPLAPVVVQPGDTLTVDRRGVFRWEQNLVAALGAWNLAGVSAFGV